MDTFTVILLIVIIIVVYGLVFYKVRENFTSNMLTDAANTIAIQWQQRKCVPLYNALNNNDNDMPLSQEFRLVSTANSASNVCMMKMDDALFTQGSSNCDISNTRLYNSSFADVVDYITPGSEIDPNHSTIGDVNVCYIEFKDGADPNRIIEYASYLNSQDPNIQSLTAKLNEDDVKVASLNSSLATANANYANSSSQLAQSQSDLTACQSASSTCLTDKATFSNQAYTNAQNYGNCQAQLKNAQAANVTFNPQSSMLKSSYPGKNKCVDILNISKDDWAPAILYDCWGGPNQKWTLDDKMRLVSQNSGKCLDLYRGGTDNGNGIIQYACHDGPNMKWIYDGKGRLRNYKDPMKCLDINNQTGDPTVDGVTKNLNRLMIWPCHDGASQVWNQSS